MLLLRRGVRLFACIGLVAVYTTGSVGAADGLSREEKVRADRARVEADGFWIYNDLPRAYREAERTGKPLLVSLRCIPCEECVKLDDELIDQDPVIRPLLQKFVCVRVVGTNGLDLDTFQYDTDQSFAMFMLNADKTIYGRFGTRSHRTDWLGDVSVEGMAAALEGALLLHAKYPEIRNRLEGKRGESLEFSSPEKYPTLRDKYSDKLNYSGNVVQSCIHCHQIGDARRDFYWQQNEAIPEKLLFPYPHPKSIGLILDPKHRARVSEIRPETPAAQSGLQEGDDIISLDGQPLLSMADVQWVLHQQDSRGAEMDWLVRRDGQLTRGTMVLRDGWRRLDDPRWRVASWGLARMMTGGMRLEALSQEERAERKVPDGQMALRVTHAGKYGDHATARRAGMRPDDIVMGYDGRTDLMREADLFAYASENRKIRDRVAIRFVRDGRERTLQIPIQK